MGKRHRASDVSRTDKKKKSRKRGNKIKEEKIAKTENGESDALQMVNATFTKIKEQPSGERISNYLIVEDKPVFFRRRAKLSISLLPWSLKDCKKAVENSLRKMVLKFSNGLGGILMAYDDVEFDNHGKEGDIAQGWILNELPHIHYDVSCSVLVFYPSIGCQLQGVVNKCFPSHVGILVFGYVNAMVSAITIREAGYVWDDDLQTWTKGGESITSGVKINFVVTQIHECDGTISLEGDKPARSLLVETSGL